MREEHEDRLDTAFIEETAEAAERLLGAGRYFLAALYRPKDAARTWKPLKRTWTK